MCPLDPQQLGLTIVFAGLPTLYVLLWAAMRLVVNKFPRKVFD